MKKKVNETLMQSIVGGILQWAARKEIKNDPELQKTLRNYQSEIARLSQEIEDSIAELDKLNKPRKK